MMTKLLWLLIAVLVAFLIFDQLARADGPSIVDQAVDVPARLTVGDHFFYTIKVDSDAGTNVFLAPGGLPNSLALAKTPESSNKQISGGRIETTIKLELAAFVPGDVSIDTIQLRYKTREGATGDLKTTPEKITVASVLTPGAPPDVRDLKPQAEIGKPAATWFYYAIGAAVIALVLIVGLLLWRRRVLKRRAAYVEPELEVAPLTPEDKARGELDEAGREFATAGEYGRYYATIGVTVRTYLTTRFGFHAFALTTVELQNEMQQRGLDRWQARLVSGLLTQCDTAVYAGYRPASERADADLTAAYEIVEMSRPQPPVVEVTAT